MATAHQPTTLAAGGVPVAFAGAATPDMIPFVKQGGSAARWPRTNPVPTVTDRP